MTLGANYSSNSSQSVAMGVRIDNGAALDEPWGPSHWNGLNGYNAASSWTGVVSTSPGSHTFTVVYGVSGGPSGIGTYWDRRIVVIPLP